MLRKILAVIIGILVGGVGITLIQMVSTQMYPLPEGMDYNDAEAFGTYVQTLPVGAFLMVILSYIVGSFFGGLTGTAIAKQKYTPALIVGIVLTLAGIANAMAIPQPLWVSIVSIIVFIPLACLGAKIFPVKNQTSE